VDGCGSRRGIDRNARRQPHHWRAAKALRSANLGAAAGAVIRPIQGSGRIAEGAAGLRRVKSVRLVIRAGDYFAEEADWASALRPARIILECRCFLRRHFRSRKRRVRGCRGLSSISLESSFYEHSWKTPSLRDDRILLAGGNAGRHRGSKVREGGRSRPGNQGLRGGGLFAEADLTQ